MNHRDRHSRLTERDLIALADGSLPATRRALVERAVAASPQLQASVTAQRRALRAIAYAGSERAPTALRTRLALAPRPCRGALPRPLVRAYGSTATALAAMASAVVLAFMLGSGATGQPSVADAAVLASRAPLAPAPSHRGESVLLHGPRGAGLPFPYWEDRFGFKAVGTRSDRLGGRVATTVFYSRGGQRIAYTIVSGPPLAAETATRTTLSDRSRLRSFTDHGRVVVTWLRRRHTCVLSGTHSSLGTLLRLASWRGGGEIPY